MRFCDFTQQHGSADDRANLSCTRGLKGFVDIGKISSGRANDAQPTHIDSFNIQFDCPTAMSARGHEPSAYGQTV